MLQGPHRHPCFWCDCSEVQMIEGIDRVVEAMLTRYSKIDFNYVVAGTFRVSGVQICSASRWNRSRRTLDESIEERSCIGDKDVRISEFLGCGYMPRMPSMLAL